MSHICHMRSHVSTSQMNESYMKLCLNVSYMTAVLYEHTNESCVILVSHMNETYLYRVINEVVSQCLI